MNIKVVTVIGANGTMGRNVAAIFASFGNAKVYMVCRTKEKAEKAVISAYNSIRTESIKKRLIPITYDDMEKAIKESDLIFESLSEDIEIKKNIYKEIKKLVNSNVIIASGTSGLSITKLSEELGGYSKNFFGMHFFNPPYVLSLCELIFHNENQRELLLKLKIYLEKNLNRTVVITKDTPSFLGNRIGFYFINEALQLAEKNKDNGGIDYIDAILGGFTGRNMPPLCTADFVGLDVSKSILDYIYDNIDDNFKESFKIPNYIEKLLNDNCIGKKSGCGLYKNENNIKYVYDIKNSDYRLQNKYEISFINEMKKNIKVGNYEDAFDILLNDDSKEAIICKEMILKYIVYSLYVSNLVTDNIYFCDDAMANGFNWLPPISYIDLLGGKENFYLLSKKYLNENLLHIIEDNNLLEKINDKSKYDYKKFIKLN